MIYPDPAAVKYHVVDDRTSTLIWNSSGTEVPVTLNMTGTTPGQSYDQDDGYNPYTIRYCYNASCSVKAEKEMLVVADNVASPGIAITAGPYQIFDAAYFPSQCPVNFGRFIGQSDELCVLTDSLHNMDDFNGSSHMAIRLQANSFTGDGVVFDAQDYPYLPDDLDDFCDARPDECDHVNDATISAVMASYRCEGDLLGDSRSDAVRHIVWSSQIAARFKFFLNLTASQARAKAEEWLDEHESAGQQSGCTSVNNPPSTSEDMDCTNNDIGLDFFENNPNINLIDLWEAAYIEAQVNSDVVVLSGSNVCTFDPL